MILNGTSIVYVSSFIKTSAHMVFQRFSPQKGDDNKNIIKILSFSVHPKADQHTSCKN
jgi:hypothetical protein